MKSLSPAATALIFPRDTPMPLRDFCAALARPNWKLRQRTEIAFRSTEGAPHTVCVGVKSAERDGIIIEYFSSLNLYDNGRAVEIIEADADERWRVHGVVVVDALGEPLDYRALDRLMPDEFSHIDYTQMIARTAVQARIH